MIHAMTRRTAASLLALGPALLGASRSTLAAEPPKDPPVFRIGALLGLTDKANWNATVMQRGILMAVDEINAKGGIDGIKVEAAMIAIFFSFCCCGMVSAARASTPATARLWNR